MQPNSRINLLFDFDGTLADSFEATFQIGNKLAARYGYPPLTRAEAAELRNRSLREIISKSEIPLRKIPAWLREFRRKLHEKVPEMRPFPKIEEALRQLQQNRAEMGIVTSNSRENVELFLQNNGWTDLFPKIECSTGLFGKHRLIRKIARTRQLSPENFFYIGDEVRDIAAARAAGVSAIAVTWGFNTESALAEANPDFLFNSPDELIRLLA